jgi:hypothetical protein
VKAKKKRLWRQKSCGRTIHQQKIDSAMKTNDIRSTKASQHQLTEVIEPLASYICAAEKPREALLSALSALFDEVQGTHKATLMHFVARRVDSLGLAL